MTDHHFLSYSSADALEFACWLFDQLSDRLPACPVWLDKRCLKPGRDWDAQIAEALERCRTLLFVMSEDSVEELSVCKQEWSQALKYKKPVIPLLLHDGAQPPFRLQDRQYLDFTGDGDEALKRLGDHLVWIESAAGRLQEVKYLLADAQRDLRRRPEGPATARIRDEIEEHKKQIAHWKAIAENPAAAARRVDESIARGIERERQPTRPVAGIARSRFINPPPGSAPKYFQDREVETRLIVDFLHDESKRVITVVGRGGLGKTALVCRLLKALENGLLPHTEEQFPIDGIVYLSAAGLRRVSMPNLFEDLCRLLPEEKSGPLSRLLRESQAGAGTKMLALLEAFPQGRTVVLMDNFENLVDGPTREVNDRELRECLQALLTAPLHGVKVIITTRLAPRDLALVAPACQSRIDLDEGLPEPFAENILRALDVDGKVGLRDAPAAVLAEARVRTRGYPRALEALFAILSADRDTTLADVLRDTQKFLPEHVVEVLVGEAFNRLDRPAQQVMQALAIYGRPVTPVAVDFLLAPHVPGIDSAPMLNRLLNMQLVRKEGGRFYLHPIDRDYAFGRVEEGEPSDCIDDGVPRFSRFALRHRGAEFFRQARKPRSDWKTLDDLTPQLAEFDLRCLNGDHQTAFDVLREIDFQYLLIWGHYRQMADMHLRLKGHLKDARSRQASLNSLGLALENLGNYEAASTTYEAAIRLACELGARDSEAVALSNKAICHVRLGETARAVQCNTRALAIVRALGDLPSTVNNLNNLANRYADLGDNRQALLLYEEALPIARRSGNRYAEAVILESSGHVLLAMDRFAEAEACYRGALRVADAIKSVQVQNYAHWGLAMLALVTCELAAARRGAEAATHYAVPDNDHHVLALLGVIRLRQGDLRTATEAFQESVTRCDRMLQLTTRNYAAMDCKAVAQCGLILCGADLPLGNVLGLLRAARGLNRDAGIVARLLRLFSTLAKADRDDRIRAALQVAAGEP